MKFKLPITIFLLQNSSLAINLGTQIILTSILPLNTFGSFAKVFVVRDILVTFLSFSIGMSVVYNRTTNKEALVATATYLSLIQVLIIFVGGLIVSTVLYSINFFSDREFLILLILIVISLFTVLHTTFVSLFEREEKFIFNSLINLAVSVLASAAVILLAYYKKDETPLLMRELIPSLVLSFLYFFLIKKYYGIKALQLRSIDKIIMKEVMNYSFKMYFSRLSEVCMFRLDLFIVSRLFDTSIVGLYERARYFATLPWTIVITYIQRIHFVKYVKSNELTLFRKTNYYSTALNFSLFLTMLLIIYLFVSFSGSEKWRQILVIIPFFAGYAIGSIVENYKTLLYAKGEVIYAMFAMRIIPIMLFIVTAIIISYLFSLDMQKIALISSLSYLSSILVTKIYLPDLK